MPLCRSVALDCAWLAACFLASSAWCVACAFRIGPTFDEPTYIAEGLAVWRNGSHGGLLSLGTMPLAIDLQTLPLYLAECWRGRPIDPVGQLDAWLPWARAMNLCFWAMLLVYVWLIGRQLAGRWGGRIAAALVACEPNLLAHASLATTDLALAACIVAALYHFERGRRSERWIVRIGVPTLWCTAAVLAKASAVVFLPLCFFAVEMARLFAHGAFSRPAASLKTWRGCLHVVAQFRPLARDYAQIALLCTPLVMAYCGTDWRTEDDFVAWARELPPGDGATAMVWLAENLRIFPNAAEAFVRQVKHNLHGHPMYLAGHAGQRGVWYYFPLLLSIKLPLPLLAAAMLLPLALRRRAWSWPLACAAMLLAYSFTFRVQIGVRMVLPIIVLVAIAVAVAIVRQQQMYQGWPRRCAVAMTASILIALAGVSWSAWPHGLCYANALWGGTQRSYLVVSDSNYDWGQGIPDLLRWQRAHGGAPIDVWYFGADPAIHRPPLRHLPLHTMQVDSPPELMRVAQGRYLAVGATIVYGGYVVPDDSQPASRLVRYFRTTSPADRAGPLLIYDLAADPRWAQVQEEKMRLARATPDRNQTAK